MADLVQLDGRTGEGGGQILRSALALSLASGRPFRIDHIRGGRTKPGLLRQHLASIRAVRAISGGQVEGAELGSAWLVFRPGLVRGGIHRIEVGSAGSTALVAQAAVPALLHAEGPSRLAVTGGTHASYAPPFEFLRDTLDPLLGTLGHGVRTTLVRHGFFPAGGGEIKVDVSPAASPRPLTILERGRLLRTRADALVANLPAQIAERELRIVGRKLDWSSGDLHVVSCDADGPGNALLLTLAFEHVTEVIAAFGKRGVSAEQVARRACRDAQAYLRTEAPVGEHLADQLMLPLALGAGGHFRTGPLSKHAETNLETLQAFLDVPVQVARDATRGTVDVRIGGWSGGS